MVWDTVLIHFWDTVLFQNMAMVFLCFRLVFACGCYGFCVITLSIQKLPACMPELRQECILRNV